MLNCSSSFNNYSISFEILYNMFTHYIERLRYNQSHDSASQDGLWSAGEIKEAERWLKLFHVDLSYFHIQEMVNGKEPIQLRFAEECE